MSNTKEKKPLFSKEEKEAFNKAKNQMFQDLENLWSDYGLALEEIRELKRINQK